MQGEKLAVNRVEAARLLSISLRTLDSLLARGELRGRLETLLDKQGRVLLPDKMLKRAGIGKDVTLAGVKDHMELWNRSEWEDERDALLRRRAEIALKARQARQQDSI